MGGNFKDFAFADSSGSMFITVFISTILVAVFGYIAYKSYVHYIDSRKWSWFTQLCKEKRMSIKETTYLKNVVIRKKILTVDDLFGSIYSLNLPTPIKRKLLWEDEPLRSPAARKTFRA